MSAYQRALDISAHNVANASTDGFQPLRTNFSTQTAGGVQASVAPSTIVSLSTPNVAAPLPSGTDLAGETVGSMIFQHGFEMSAKMVKVADQMLGTLIDIRA